MPDDVTITEQNPVQGAVNNNPADEAAGFKTDKADLLEDKHGEFTEGLETAAAVKDKKQDTDSGKFDDKEAATADADDSVVVDDDDDDIKRGREIISENEKAETAAASQKQAAATDTAQSQQAPAYDPLTEQHDAKSIDFFKGVIPKGLFPKEPITLADGTELDFNSVIENEPEIPVMVAIIANNIVKQMVKNGYLATTDSTTSIRSEVDNKLFVRTLTNKVDGVPNARQIYADPKFKEWFGKEPKEVQALLRSEDPYDHIRVFKRFINKSGKDAADSKVVAIDKKRAEMKANFDGLHKTTVRSKGKPKGSAMTPREEELEGFSSKDEDDDFYR